MVYWETFDVLESLVDGDAKVMMSAIRQYSQYGVLPGFTGNAILTTLWLLIRPKLDADSERYERIREARVEAGRKGGLTRASKAKQIQANEANANFAKQIKPTTTTTASTSTTTNPTANPKTDSDNKGCKEIQGTVNRPYTPPPSLGDMDKLLEEIEQRRAAAQNV